MVATQTKLIDPQEVQCAIRTLIEPEAVFEIRILDGVIDNPRFPTTYAGYFKNTDESIAILLKKLTAFKSAEAMYFTAQVVNPRLIARINQTFKKVGSGEATKDTEIHRYRLLLIDIDPDRPQGIPSTEDEHRAALKRCQEIKNYLKDQGFSDPIEGDSGNGGHLSYLIDMANTPENKDLYTRFLNAISAKFGVKPSDGSLYLKIDTTVYNPSRIWKLYGTRACKGSDSPDFNSPHRMSRLLHIPAQLQVTPRELLEAIAVPVEQEQPKQEKKATDKSTARKKKGKQKLPSDYLDEWHVPYKDSVPYNGGQKWQLEKCPFCGNSDHNAFVYISSNDELGFKCSHNSCTGLHWKDFRLKFDPTAYDREHTSEQEDSAFNEIQAKVIDATEKEDVEALYKLAEQDIAFLPFVRREILVGLVKSGMDKCKKFSLKAFNKLISDAEKAKRAEERAEREPASEYERTDSGMVYNSEMHGPVTLSNFTAEITNDLRIDDGVERTRFYALQAELYGRRFSFEVPAKDLARCDWVDQELGARARVSAGNSIKAHLTNAIKACSDPKEQEQYAHTGWRDIEGRLVFLHNGSCLGQVGQVVVEKRKDLTKTMIFGESALQATLERERESNGQLGQLGQVNIQASVRLTGSLSKYVLPCARESMQQAIRASLGFINLASDTITAPLYGALCRSVLGDVDFGIHLAGQTGWGKSELCALIQQHFGPQMHAKNLPGSWESTENSLEMLLFQAKDAIVVVDDFKPKGGKGDQDRLHAKADRIFRQIGNGQSRGRLTSNLDQRPERPPRCMLLSTGEDIPRGQSLKARGVVLIMNERITAGPASKKLTEAQKQARQGLYAQAMAGYIEWLAPRIQAIQAQLPDILAEERDQLRIDGHARSVPNTANLILGIKCFLHYAYEMGAITEQEAQIYLARCKTALIQIAEEASREDKEEKETEKWRRLIVAALTSGRAHLVTPAGDNPGLGYGWKKSIRSSSYESGEDETYYGGGDKIGWIDGDDIYLEPKAAYTVAKSLGSSDLTTLELTLRKFLYQDGLLASTNLKTSRRTYTVRRDKLEGDRKEVLHIKKHTLFSNDPPVNPVDQPDQVDQEPSETASEESSDSGQVPDQNREWSSDRVDPDLTKKSTETPNNGAENGTYPTDIPQEYRELLVRYQRKIFSLNVETPIWQATDNGFKTTYFGKKEHIEYTKTLLRSGEARKIQAAIEAMERTLGEYGEVRNEAS